MIVIVSTSTDFLQLLSEHITRELGLGCKTMADLTGLASESDAKLLITTENIEILAGMPALTIPRQPARLQDLLAQIAEILHKPATAAITLAPGITLLPLHKEVHAQKTGKSITLTDKEIQLLSRLLAADAQGIAKETLLKDIWGFETDMDTHTLETHISRLRSKFKELGLEQSVVAEDGGYRLEIA